MDINVSHLLKSSVGTTRSYDVEPGDELLLDSGMVALLDGVHVRLDRTNTGILARGHADATVTVPCSRCLDNVEEQVSIDFAEEYQPSVDVTTGRPLPKPDDELIFSISPNHVLDLGEALRQNLLAAMPIQTLCQEECAGLCPICGVNRNKTICTCDVGDEAPLEPGMTRPFAALADLLPQIGE